MKATFLVVGILIILPFLVYLFSKIQMLAWLKMLDESEVKLDVATKIEEKRKKEESCNGKEEKRI